MKNTMKKGNYQSELLKVKGLDVDTPAGRPLFRDLNLSLGYEQVAIIGRNGVGKSTLIEILSQQLEPTRGQVVTCYDTVLVYQELSKYKINTTRGLWPSVIFSDVNISKANLEDEFKAIGLRPVSEIFNSEDLSNGELRKLYLLAAKFKYPKLLLLDEPTEDLDEVGILWLQDCLINWSDGLLVISHERRILQHFSHFFIVTESGCRYFNGNLSQLEKILEEENKEQEKKYIRHINHLINREEHNLRVAQRRKQKKNQGRLRELGRMTPRVRLNKKRSHAQESQGRVAKISQNRIEVARNIVQASRRELAVKLPIALFIPELPDNEDDIVILNKVSLSINERTFFNRLNLRLKRNRIAITGPNGSGKTLLLKTILKQHSPSSGFVTTNLEKVGSIAQGASNWMLEDNLITYLQMISKKNSVLDLTQLLIAHKFPLALAERPLRTLSPGERVRAALICLFARSPIVECLVLDEPTYSLDLVGYAALREALKTWPGGLILVSHDQEFLKAIRIDRKIDLNKTP